MHIDLFAFYLSSCSWRVRIVLAHKGLDYTLHPVALSRGEHLQDAHGARHPLHQVPVLRVTEPGTPALLLTQSVAICEYLEERFPEPALLPADSDRRAQTRALVETVNAGIQPLQGLGVRRHVESLDRDADAFARHFVERGFSGLESLLCDAPGPFAMGTKPTLADVFLWPQIFNARSLRVDLEPLPRLREIESACEGVEAWRQTHPSQQPDYVAPEG